MKLIRLIAGRYHRRYGNPRMREELRRDYGTRVSRKKVARLMRENGLNAQRRRKCIPPTNSNHGPPVCENLLDREFHAEGSGEKRVSDILRTKAGWVYLPAVLDLYDRKVIGWAFSADTETVYTTCPGDGRCPPPAQGWPHLLFGPGSAVLREGLS